MRNLSALRASLLTTALCIVLSSCKYEDGPFLSFRSRNKRLQQTWVMTDQWINGVKSDAPSRNYVQTYETFGEFRASNYDLTGDFIQYTEGGWEFENKDEILHMSKTRTFKTTQGTTKKETITHIATVLRLTKKDLWYEYLDTKGNTVKEYYKPFN